MIGSDRCIVAYWLASDRVPFLSMLTLKLSHPIEDPTRNLSSVVQT